jgi:hypothetical protein
MSANELLQRFYMRLEKENITGVAKQIMIKEYVKYLYEEGYIK